MCFATALPNLALQSRQEADLNWTLAGRPRPVHGDISWEYLAICGVFVKQLTALEIGPQLRSGTRWCRLRQPLLPQPTGVA